ncbi:hypothetical protein D8674_019874 [Pyrus ussuriensis x Pyrus communis]|uniref:Uncharacterized protein n=1 Tax=Pyrus ussuriensis x Pyrus communis TaxID=2448454 RepID=A0A5N5GED4_9ROSA|nr:hypothetical protein D8674_019874 [Pyrus ussuriensis x Pyrus communis]
MATTSRSLHRAVRLWSFSISTTATDHNSYQQKHYYTEHNCFIGCWEAPKDPKKTKLAQLRRYYAKQVKEVRKKYIKEIKLMRLTKRCKDEAHKERKVAEQEFHQALKVGELEGNFWVLNCFDLVVFKACQLEMGGRRSIWIGEVSEEI